MALQLGLFYRMDAVIFRRLQSLRQHFDQQFLNQKLIQFVPLLKINEDDYKNFELIKKQIKQYCFLLDQQNLKSRIKFDSYQILNSSEVHLTGSYNLHDLKDILIDLKILLESHLSNPLIDLSEQFLEPSIKLVQHFEADKLDDLLSRLGTGEQFNFHVDIKNFGYLETNSMGQVEKLYQEFSDIARSPGLFHEEQESKKTRLSEGDYH